MFKHNGIHKELAVKINISSQFQRNYEVLASTYLENPEKKLLLYAW